MPGSTASPPRAWLASWDTPKAATAEAIFDRKAELQERLRQGPGLSTAQHTVVSPTPATPETTQQVLTPPTAPPTPTEPLVFPANRWTLDSIRVSCDWLSEYSTSGVWRLLDRYGLRLRSGRVQHYSPDPEYAAKVANLEMCLWEARRYPRSVVAVFLDEMGYSRWPDPGPDWGATQPVADRLESKNGLWRVIGSLNALTGQVNYLDGYIVGRAKVIQFYEQLLAVYPKARRLYVIQDNWSIHTHADVLEALSRWPRIEPVWLPTYAPWLNPIEKLWRWLRQDVLKLHRLANDWKALRGRVCKFFDQFRQGSQRLLEYVGLLGSGTLAQMILGP